VKHPEVLYEDESCIAVNKPAGLAVQGGKGVGVSLDDILAQKREQRPLLVHRLDKDTSGVILVAKTKPAAAAFSRLFRTDSRKVDAPPLHFPDVASSISPIPIKRYLAICKGRPDHKEGEIVTDLEIQGKVKKSRTCFRLLENFTKGDEFSLLELELGTGRMHQIRRHLAMTGNPVLGDDKYGDFKLNRKLRKEMNLRRLLLHASRLIIPETSDTVFLDITAPLPEYFREWRR
jgi:23S rRNA pseudouridine955/2504/2580 synthase